jgi:sulfide dehydrogenase cytochrome subunit
MNATRILVAGALGFAAMPIALAAAADAPPGAASCTGCHPASAGVDSPLTPLAGRNAADLVRQMQTFRSGEVPTTVMDQIAKGFSDAEVQAIAAWYAEQK